MKNIAAITMFQRIGCCFILCFALFGCRTPSEQREKPEYTQAPTDSKPTDITHLTQALADFNRGSALLEQYKYVEASKAFETVVETAPDWAAARFNLGLAYLNMQEQAGAESYLALAQESFEAVLQSDPNNLSAQFCLGLYYQHLGENEKALDYFQSVSKADPNDPYVLYKCAEALINLGRNDEGIKLLENVIDLDPGFVSGAYRLATQYQRTRRREKALPLFARFKALKDTELTGGSFTVLKTYGTVGKYYMALGADNLPLRSETELTPKRIIFSPELKPFDAVTSTWEFPGGSINLPGIAVGDVDDDGDLDLCMTALGAEVNVKLWLNDGSGKFSSQTTLAQHGISPCFGDMDNDGDLDLWLGCAGTDMYFENDGKAHFTKGQADGITSDQNATACARLFDADSDGDLDFLAVRLARGTVPATGTLEPAGSSLYNNNRDGSFTDMAEKLGLIFENTAIASMVYDDFDNDRDLDIVIFPAGENKVISWVNDRAFAHRILDAETTGLSVEGVLSATTGDPDKDGDRDLLIFTNDGLHLYVNQDGFRFERHEDFSDRFGRLRATGGQFVDMDNDGDLDILIADTLRRDGRRGPALLINDSQQKRFIDIVDVDPGNLLSAIHFQSFASCVAADFTGNGKCDILLAPIGERPFLIENVTPGGHWIEIDLRGTQGQDRKTRSSNSAIGARVEINSGTLFQQYVVGISSGPVSMAPYRIHAGLGENTKVDWLRIVWPDAVLQAELELAADQVMKIEELQRKVSSCPHLFAWDGSHFEFISDFGGMGGIGYLATPGEYAKPDPTEYVPIPNLEPLNGEYIFQVLEPLEETVYFDEAKLIAVDHPTGTRVYPHEMMAINISPPPFELFCFRETIEPIGAVDHRGVDVTDQIREVDRRYAGATEPDERFIGLAADHYVELDFGDRLKSVSPGSRLVLFLQGWVEYPYSSTNFASSQANLSARAPSIHVFRNGQWIELFDQVGYPAGIRHMMTLDVTGKLLPGDRKIRLSSNMELYWDQIFLAPVLEEPGLNVREVPVKSADLHFLGYPQEYSPDGRHPTLYDYGNVDRSIPWKMMKGDYTRYGEVSELLGEADDCYVIMGRGEEVTLRFSADAFGPIPEGYHRSFILKTDSFCKDMDLYSAYPDTVEPLPFHSMSTYPYGANEKYPDDEKRREYRKRYNTRRIGDVGN